jgi:purine-cytosine permease-like protein
MTRSDMRPAWQRVGQEIETVGVLPVPDRQRRTTSGKLLIVWAMTSASATTPLIGSLLFHLGLRYMVGAIAASWAIFLIPCGLFSEMGRELPLTALIVARRNYGWSATFCFSVLFTFVNMAWFGLNTATGALILAALSFWGTSIFRPAFYDNVPLALFGSLAAAVVYLAYVLVRDRTRHARAAAVRPSAPRPPAPRPPTSARRPG